MPQAENNKRKLINRKGVEIETHYSDKDAFARLESLVRERKVDGFAADLVQRGRKYGLTEEQFFWIHKLLLDHEHPPIQVVYEQISAAFERARQNGVRARNLKIKFGNFEGEKIQLSVAGSRSKHEGNIWVVLPESDIYCGRITPNGVFISSGRCPDPVMDELDKMNDNVEAFLPW